jgi:hypothetical protein
VCSRRDLNPHCAVFETAVSCQLDYASVERSGAVGETRTLISRRSAVRVCRLRHDSTGEIFVPTERLELSTS